ncbi:molecular chaperone HtpG, partial [bacterium]|nr:molecular chaperone HtpG [bacterium]
IIGHFGLGFYSSFMVASKVMIRSLSHKPGATSALWECDGSTAFSIVDGDRTEIGTDVILHIPDENEEYVFEGRIEELVKKYANFLPVEITVNGKAANAQNPLWVKSPSEVTEDEYKSFYQTLFPYNPEPLFWIHLNVDYPFNLKGILYFPKLIHELDAQKGQVKLFCRQVFVSDSAKEVLPDFLTILQGAIDCPDLPLNVSRSFLQNDPYVQKIAKHVVKKVADKLIDEFRGDRSKFAGYWDDISPFVKFGMINNAEFFEKAREVVIFKTTEGKDLTVANYIDANPKLEKKIVYTSNKEAQGRYVQLCKDQGLDVVVLQSVIDSHFIQFLEGNKESEVKFVSVESALADHLSGETAEDDAIQQLFTTALGNDKLKVTLQTMGDSSVPAILTQPEFSKRMQEMAAAMGQRGGMSASMFEDYTLVVNTASPIVQQIKAMGASNLNSDLVNNVCRYVYDLALMGQRPLSGDQMNDFVLRSNQLLGQLLGSSEK